MRQLVKVMVLVVAIALVPLSAGLVMVKQQQNTKDALDRALTTQASEQYTNFQSARTQGAATLTAMSANPVLNYPFTHRKLSASDRSAINGALKLVGTKIYGSRTTGVGIDALSGHCPLGGECRLAVFRTVFTPKKGSAAHKAMGIGVGAVDARAERQDELATIRLNPLSSTEKAWIGAVKKLKPGNVYIGGLEQPSDTNHWVMTFATPLPQVDGKSRGILYFELDLENYRESAAQLVKAEKLSNLKFLIIDHEGHVLLNSSLRQGTLELAGAGDRRFVPISKEAASSGITTVSTRNGPFRVAWQRLPLSKMSENRWTIIATAPAPSGNIVTSNPIPVGLMGLALLVIAFVMGRRWVHTSTQAMTDPLTGLGNRRKLVADLQKILPSANETAPLLLTLFDLDGFKNYNDSFGHPAGDALLTRLGRNLQSAMHDHGGEAYRMGGDEFCIIATIGTDGQAPIITDASASLSERGEGFAIGSSFGTVLLPQEAGDVAVSLRLADQRLYANKNSGRRSAGRQSADVLLQALHERSPELGDHLVDVAHLAAEVGRRLGMSGEELDQLAQAAQLHDVGKMAIPDAILKKPGPLDREEWEFIRGHTVVGERIISAAPSLAQVSRIVRSSHERYNGSGYPDGLKGEEIPLPSRIIAVCDAYDAMIGPRPYRLGMSRKNADAELRRCAGAQFDPVVIDFFLSVVDELEKERQNTEDAEKLSAKPTS
jgi:diguanylate cyclase (GGDEF)-like protein